MQVELRGAPGAAGRAVVAAWAAAHGRHVLDTAADPETWPPLAVHVPGPGGFVAVCEDTPRARLPPQVSIQFVLTSPDQPVLPTAQLLVRLPSAVSVVQIRQWIDEDALPRGTPAGATVAQLLPLLRMADLPAGLPHDLPPPEEPDNNHNTLASAIYN